MALASFFQRHHDEVIAIVRLQVEALVGRCGAIATTTGASAGHEPEVSGRLQDGSLKGVTIWSCDREGVATCRDHIIQMRIDGPKLTIRALITDNVHRICACLSRVIVGHKPTFVRTYTYAIGGHGSYGMATAICHRDWGANQSTKITVRGKSARNRCHGVESILQPFTSWCIPTTTNSPRITIANDTES